MATSGKQQGAAGKAAGKTPGTAVAPRGAAAPAKGGSKALVVEEERSTAVGEVIDPNMFLEDAEKEKGRFTAQDLAIPYLRILQKGSPQVNKRDDAYVEGAEPGDFYNSATGQLWKGEEGVPLVLVSYTRRLTEWRQRENGGGFIKDHGANFALLDQATRNEQNGRDILPNGNQLTTSADYFVYIPDLETGDKSEAIVSLSSTQLKKSRKLNGLLNQLREDRPDGGTFCPAMFYWVFRATSTYEENDKGDWMGWVFTKEARTIDLPYGAGIYLSAKQFKEQIEAGNVKVAPPVDVDAEPAAAGEDDEF